MSAEPLHKFVSGNMPTVSVVIPSFKKAPFLKDTIESVIAQEYPHVEILVVNDGSPDDTSSVTREIMSLHPKWSINLLEKDNGGISHARNFAIERAKGRLILNLDGDDLLKPGFIVKGLEVIRREERNLITCNVELFGEETGIWTPQLYDDFVERYGNVIPTLVMYDKELWSQVGGYRTAFPFNEDWDFFLRCQKLGLSVGRIPETLFRYRVSREGLAHRYIKESGHKSIALVMIANPDLYPVEEIISSHKFFGTVPTHWVEAFTEQNRKHPDQWILKFWLGLTYQGRGDIEKAKAFLSEAGELTEWMEWQIVYCLGVILEVEEEFTKAAAFFHRTRVLRPDMRRFIDEHLKRITQKVESA